MRTLIPTKHIDAGHSKNVPDGNGLPSTPGHVVMLLDNHFAPDRRVLREARLLAERGTKVTILAWDRRTQPPSGTLELPPGIGLRRINVPAPPGGGRRTLVSLVRFAVRAWPQMGPLLREAGLFVVHDVYLLPFGVAISHRWQVPLVYDAHEDFVMMEAGRLPGVVVRAVAALESLLARRAALVVVPGQVRRRRWTDAGFSPPIVLANSGVPSAEVEDGDTTVHPTWDLVYCGLLDSSRRPDLLVELAKLRPDLRVAIAGSGRAEDEIRAAAGGCENLDFLGWTDDPGSILRRSRAIYYGLDPEDPYSEGACPNNVSQAIRARRPLIFFCGGEAAEMASRFRVGLRVAATAPAIAEAVDVVITGSESWEFDEAASAIEQADSGLEYLSAMAEIARRSSHRAR